MSQKASFPVENLESSLRTIREHSDISILGRPTCFGELKVGHTSSEAHQNGPKSIKQRVHRTKFGNM